MAKRVVDYGVRLTCPRCKRNTVNPTLSVLHCGGTCSDKRQADLPLCFKAKDGDDFSLILRGVTAPESQYRLNTLNTLISIPLALAVVPASNFKWKSGCCIPVGKVA